MKSWHIVYLSYVMPLIFSGAIKGTNSVTNSDTKNYLKRKLLIITLLDDVSDIKEDILQQNVLNNYFLVSLICKSDFGIEEELELTCNVADSLRECIMGNIHSALEPCKDAKNENPLESLSYVSRRALSSQLIAFVRKIEKKG